MIPKPFAVLAKGIHFGQRESTTGSLEVNQMEKTDMEISYDFLLK